MSMIVNPLLRILHSSKETERVVLSYILAAARDHPVSYLCHFLVCAEATIIASIFISLRPFFYSN